MNHTAIEPTAPGGDDDWLVSMPKADLHVHLVGSAAPATVAALAARHPDSGVPADAGELAAFYRFRDFAHFLDVYKLVSDLVRSPEDVVTLVAGMAGDMAGQGTVYAEVTVTPVSHISAGIHPGELAQALDIGTAAARARGVELAWVYDISALVERDGAHRTLDAALHHPPAALTGFGSAGRKPGSAGPASATSSPPPGPPGCTACRTPARASAPVRCGPPSTSLARSGSATA